MSDDEFEATYDSDVDEVSPVQPVAMPRIPEEMMPPITNRFLFVAVAAQRAKQLRRGALPRLEALRPDPTTGERPAVTSRLEKVAMDEGDEGLVVYEAPDSSTVEAES